jgi:hypothetical protein
MAHPMLAVCFTLPQGVPPRRLDIGASTLTRCRKKVVPACALLDLCWINKTLEAHPQCGIAVKEEKRSQLAMT